MAAEDLDLPQAIALRGSEREGEVGAAGGADALVKEFCNHHLRPSQCNTEHFSWEPWTSTPAEDGEESR